METRRISWRISRADMATVRKILERADAMDITGIYRHLDRTTGRLADCFVPRCARPKQTRAFVRKRAFRKLNGGTSYDPDAVRRLVEAATALVRFFDSVRPGGRVLASDPDIDACRAALADLGVSIDRTDIGGTR